jgi:caffeoyl-CoA O-methyltransferase
MNQSTGRILIIFMSISTLFVSVIPVPGQKKDAAGALDAVVEKYLHENRWNWHDFNVSYKDGKVLYDLIIKNRYTRVLEIGTSTGHSSIWMAWAVSKTGGRLVTIEIDEGRYRTALKNFKQAGVEEFIDARLGDAHRLVKELKGPFDFVFSDADKDWYIRYFKEVDPKLTVGGCFTAHNVAIGFIGIKEFLDYVRSLPNYETTIDRSSLMGISISYKKSHAPSPR